MTQDEARKYFGYDADTGELTWRVSKNYNALAGSKAGADRGDRYLTVKISQRHYLVHRLIWLWVHGYFPEHQIDHINRDPSDNRLENLREVTQSCNMRNANQLSNNTSGVTGVVWHKRGENWQAQIKVNSRYKYLGSHTDFTEAVKARHAAEVEHNWPGCNSSTDAYRYLKEADHA